MNRTEPVTSPLLCDPDQKAILEARNGFEQLRYIEYLVEALNAKELRQSYVFELHKLAIEGIFGCGGVYRTVTNNAELKGGGVVHQIPEPSTISFFVNEALDTLNGMAGNQESPVKRAAFALWRFNWIHPFRGGNGRTSRAVAMLILCMNNGRMIPGTPSVPAILLRRRDDYVKALRAADEADKAGKRDFSDMIQLLNDAITEQLSGVVAVDT